MVTVSEARRRVLHEQLVEKLGGEVADILMDYLPPTGWSDLARRSDVDNMAQALRQEMQTMEARLEASIFAAMNKQTRWFMASQLVLVAATIGSITAVAG
jgi:hypothetical protein